jgi:ATP phosphoribosyltransferase
MCCYWFCYWLLLQIYKFLFEKLAICLQIIYLCNSNTFFVTVMLRIAIQSKGRLNDDCMALLSDAGITASCNSRTLVAHAKGFPIDILYLRDDDIPQAVNMGVADIGIVGLNEVAERGVDVVEAMRLGFGVCRISLAVPKSADYTGLQWFNGKRVATSYPNILQRFFAQNGVDADIHVIAGSVEVAPAVGMADAIFDIVSSGGTLIQNGLREVEAVFPSETVLIATPNLSDDKLAELEKLKFRFKSIIESRGMKYVLMNIPKERVDEAVAILPGMKSPTLLPLADKDWYSLHAVINQSELWDKIEKLKEIGAQDILILALENVIK